MTNNKPIPLHFGPPEHTHARHEPELRNSAIRVFRPSGNTLNITLVVRNDGPTVPDAEISLWAAHYDRQGVTLLRMSDESDVDNRAIAAMGGAQIRRWVGTTILPSNEFFTWTSDTVVHKMPEGTETFILVARIRVPGEEPLLPELPPSRHPRFAVYVGHSPCVVDETVEDQRTTSTSA